MKSKGNEGRSGRDRSLRLFFRQVPGAIWATDRSLRVTEVMGRVLADVDTRHVVGATVGEVLGITDPTDPAVAHHQAALAGARQSFRYTYGDRVYHVNVEPRRDASGVITGCVGALVDITLREAAEAELAHSRERLADAQRLAHVGSWEWNADRDRITWSEEMYRIYGIAGGEFAGTFQAFLDRVYDDDRALTCNVVLDAFRLAQPFHVQHRIVRSDGAVRMLDSRGEVEVDAHGRRIGLVGSCWDTTHLWLATCHTERLLSLLRATLDATADGILVVDRDGHIATYNRRFLELWRIPEALAAQRQDEELLDFVRDQLADPEAFLRGVRELYGNPERESFDTLRFKDGRVFERSSRPQRVDGEISGRVWSFRDATERERMTERALRLADENARLYQSASDALRSRDEFLSIAAHEIRGPVAAMHLAVQTMQHGEAPAAVVPKLLGVIEREDRRLARFVDELLDLSRIRAGRLHFEFEQVDLSDVAREAAMRLGPELARSGSALRAACDEEVMGMWDRSRLDQVVTNLLANAIKFGQGGPIELSVAALGRSAVLVVEDHGMGIAPDVQERIFRPFERAAPMRHYGGLGLGLYIVRTLVEGMNGTVRVRSRPGAGSRFTVELPMAREH